MQEENITSLKEEIKKLQAEGYQCLLLDYEDSDSVQQCADQLHTLVGDDLYAGTQGVIWLRQRDSR